MSKVVDFNPKAHQPEKFDASKYENPSKKLEKAFEGVDQELVRKMRARSALFRSKPFLPFKKHPVLKNPALRLGEEPQYYQAILDFIGALGARGIADEYKELVDVMMDDVRYAVTSGNSFIGYDEEVISYMAYIGTREKPTKEELESL